MRDDAPRPRDAWSTLAQVVYRRTYSRADHGSAESWPQTVARVIRGNLAGHQVPTDEANRLEHFMLRRKAMPAGRGLWFSGTAGHRRLGGAALNNCWFLVADRLESFVVGQDLLMLGGGVGLSVERRFVSQLPAVRAGVRIDHDFDRPGAFEVSDDREGWCTLIRRVLEAYLVTGESFEFSSRAIRAAGAPIKLFGGTSAGAEPLVRCVQKICALLDSRAGQKLRPIDAMDLFCIIGDMVVAGNVRRSAILILGDADDDEYLSAKRFDRGPVRAERAMANLSVVASTADQLGHGFWQTYETGEPFGIVNREALRKYGRTGELRPDDAIGVNPCAEATLTPGEPCNLQEIFLPNLADEREFVEAAVLMHRWGKRVTVEPYHLAECQEAVSRYRRIGTGITGCLQSPLFNASTLDRVYTAIQAENRRYSTELGIAPSIRTTVIKPSGTLSLLGDCLAGIHPAYSRHYIRRVRFSAQDPLIPALRAAGYPIEPAEKLDGSKDDRTQVISFPCAAPAGAPIADESFGLFEQLAAVQLAQRHWADQSVSVTAYYRAEELPALRAWVNENLPHLKTISFLRHSGHGFEQAPLEPISATEYDRMTQALRPAQFDSAASGDELDLRDCEGGGCLVK